MPHEPAKQAADIADQAVLASGSLDEKLWSVYMNAVAVEPCAVAPQSSTVPAKAPAAVPTGPPSGGKS